MKSLHANRMSDIAEEDMLSRNNGLMETSDCGLGKNRNTEMMLSMNNIHSNLTFNRRIPSECNRRLYQNERERSPMSVRSEFMPQRFPASLGYHYSSSHKSLIDGRRGGSPMSLRSMDSVRSAIDITNALKQESFNMDELQMIKDVVCRKLKQKLRRRYEKNRNRLLKKNAFKLNKMRRQNNSSKESSMSMSSNDDSEIQSNKHVVLTESVMLTSNCKNNMNPHITMPHKKENLPVCHTNTNHLHKLIKPDSTQENNESIAKHTQASEKQPEKVVIDTYNERHTKIAGQEDCCRKNKKNFLNNNNNTEVQTEKDQYISDAKKIKVISEIKIMGKETFKKPLPPVTKSNEKNLNEIVITKAPLQPLRESNQIVNDKTTSKMEISVDDLSTKSSFSKRKLFTQKLDMLSNNLTNDCAGESPKVNSEKKQKNKTRKLVTSQSCLINNVSDEDDNVLDLVHKIVPADEMNVTSNNKTEVKCAEGKYNSDVSETFTDETLNGTIETYTKKDHLSQNIECRINNFSIVLNRINTNNAPKTFQRSKCVNSYWETDVESDRENETVTVQKIPRPSEIKGISNATVSNLNRTKRQANKIGNVLTVQNLINKRNRKTLSRELKVPIVKDNTSENKQTNDLPEKANNAQKQIKLKRVTPKKKPVVRQSRTVKEKPNKQTTNSQLKKQSRRSKSFNRSCSGCGDDTNKKNTRTEILKKKSVITPEKEKYTRKNLLNLSLNTSDSFNISDRTRSKQQNNNTSKESSKLNDTNISISSLRPRKLKNKCSQNTKDKKFK